MSLLTEALFYEARGFSVIPIKPHEKKPLLPWEEYQKRRASPDEIQTWWALWPDANIGIVTGAISGLVVVDIHGVEAARKFKALVPSADSSHTPTCVTARGWHCFYHHPGQKIEHRHDFKPGIDIDADGWYVVAAPSIHPSGKPYQWKTAFNGILPDIPSELAQIITESVQNGRESLSLAPYQAIEEQAKDDLVFALNDAKRRLNWCRELPEADRDPVIEGAIEIEIRAIEADLRRQFSGNQPVASSQGNFWPTPETMTEFLKTPMDTTNWIWEDLLARHAMSLLVGRPRDGKSTLAVNIAMAAARGYPFLGRGMSKVRTWYISIDNSREEMRVMLQAVQAMADDWLDIHVGPVPYETFQWFEEQVDRGKYDLVIIDTLQRFFRLKSEKEYADVVNKLAKLDALAKRDHGGFHCMLLHHASRTANEIDAAIGGVQFKGMCATYLNIRRYADTQYRMIMSDNRVGRCLEPTGIILRDGWLEKAGSLEDIQIEDAKPKILELIQADQDAGITEAYIRKEIQNRGIVLSKALRQLLKEGKVEVSGGTGKKGDARKYRIPAKLFETEQNYCPESQYNDSPDLWDREKT